MPAIAHAVAVFGEEQKAMRWLTTPLALFDNHPPMELLATSEGIERVERTLTRIEQNIPS